MAVKEISGSKLVIRLPDRDTLNDDAKQYLEERMSMLDDYFFAFTGKVLDPTVGSSFRRNWIAFSKISPSKGDSDAS